MALIVVDAKFLAGTTEPESYKGSPYTQVAIAGRSNAGKSTFINRLANNSKLARTSKTPGRTQQFNFFDFRLRGGKKESHLVLVDAPGFGYAKVSKTERNLFTKALATYIAASEQVKAIVLINDARRPPEDLELAVRDFALSSGLALIVVATKLDKLSRNEQNKALQVIAEAYELSEELIVPAGEKIPTTGFWQTLNDAVALMT